MMHKHSDYMQWAKTRSRARFNLATSGVGPYPLSALRELPDLEINGDNSYGYAPLKQAIAARHGVDPDCVVTAAGTSMANYLAFAAILEPGDHVVIEQPAYSLLVDSLLYIGASITPFRRERQAGWAVDPDAVRRAMRPNTKLIVLTNLHNPTSVLTPELVLREIGEIAREAGARVLVDEVYLDAVYHNTPRTSFHLGPQFVVTSSLTKIYGVSGLRCGWILADPDLARAAWRLNDLFAATSVHPGELLSVAVLRNLDAVRGRTQPIVERDRHALHDFLDRESGVSAVRTAWGTTAFLHLEHGNVDAFAETLRAAHDTSVVPGAFFHESGCFRVGMGVDAEMFAEGLRRLGLHLRNHVQ
ncbi:MAG: aminotransferase class I/II-fold pyridoxal phosphate-dependent enzyme [Acidobacteriota bacterium]|nr:aminotransferase class I/II-fold pyridoxal phosphate-dependent enzyme [Acidobacteriota bacterium]